MMRISFPHKPIFVHEFISGGGRAGKPLPPELLVEGRAMLQAILTDFARWGRFPVVTMVDDCLDGVRLPASRVERVKAGQYGDLYTTLLTESQAALIIAPETDSHLYNLTATAEQLGVTVLGATSGGVAEAGDKWACYLRWRQAGIPTPPTRHARFDDLDGIGTDSDYPLIVKPVDGVGCEGVRLVTNSSELPHARQALRAVTARDDFLAMQYIPGVHASVSLLASRHGVQPLTLNSQHIVICDGHLAYQGGNVPLHHPLEERARSVAAQAVLAIPGLRGYVGVDLVLTEQEVFVIEVNPRLTTAYVGIRQVVDLNLAQAIWQACVDDQLPSSVPIRGQVTFTKNALSMNPTSGALL